MSLFADGPAAPFPGNLHTAGTVYVPDGKVARCPLPPMFRTLFMAPSSNDGRPPSPTETNADGDGGVGNAGVEADALTAAAPKEHLVLVGDSGTGKSTLLSTIIGRPGAFHCGISAGTGLTTYLQTVEVDGRLYSRTDKATVEGWERLCSCACASCLECPFSACS